MFKKFKYLLNAIKMQKKFPSTPQKTSIYSTNNLRKEEKTQLYFLCTEKEHESSHVRKSATVN